MNKIKEDIKSDVVIYSTADFKRFKFIDGNRFVSQNKVKTLMKVIEEGLDILKYAPIIVDNDYNIIDGQHRYHVCLKLRRSVYYIIAPSKKISDIAKINTATDKWKLTDYLDSYIATMNPDYMELEQFMEKYDLSLGVSMSLLGRGKASDGGSMLSRFKNGYFKIKGKDEAHRIASLLMDYKKYTELFKQRPFVRAINNISLHENYDHNRMMEKLEQSQTVIEKKQTPKEYIIQLESIYNFHNSKITRLI